MHCLEHCSLVYPSGDRVSYPSGSRLSGASSVLIDVTGTEDVTVWTGRTTPTEGAVPVIYCHGFGVDGDGDVWLDETRAADDLRPIAAWGHPVFVPDLAGINTWGNTAAQNAAEAIITWAHTTYGTRTDRVAFAGESMGALTALNLGCANPDRVAAMWLRVPCLGLEWTHDNVDTFRPFIEAAYGSAQAYRDALDDHDPMRNVSTIHRFRSRTRMWATAEDEFFPLDVTAAFAAQMRCRLDVIGGTHAAGYDTPEFVVAQWLDYVIRH